MNMLERISGEIQAQVGERSGYELEVKLSARDWLAVIDTLNSWKPAPEERAIKRTIEIANRALTEWAGWYDDARGGTPDEVIELRAELERLWPSQREKQ